MSERDGGADAERLNSDAGWGASPESKRNVNEHERKTHEMVAHLVPHFRRARHGVAVAHEVKEALIPLERAQAFFDPRRHLRSHVLAAEVRRADFLRAIGPETGGDGSCVVRESARVREVGARGRKKSA